MAENKLVFLVDDDKICNLINRKIILDAKFAKEVVAFDNAGDALNALSTMDYPDIIFLDINMPEMNGWEFLTEFEKLSPDLIEKCKVILLSSSVNPQDIKQSACYTTVNAYISKPLTDTALSKLAVSEN